MENHGFADLTISSVQLPPGFSLAEPLNTTIAPSTSDLFSIALETTVTGVQSGTVQIVSNDRAAADLDTDGDVDGADFLRVQRGHGIASGATLSDGDANGTGTVGADDLLLWRQQYASSTETIFEFLLEGEVTPTLSASSTQSVPAFDTSSLRTSANEQVEFVVFEQVGFESEIERFDAGDEYARSTPVDTPIGPSRSGENRTVDEPDDLSIDAFFDRLGHALPDHGSPSDRR